MHPTTLILVGGFDSGTELCGCGQREIRIADELARKEDDVGLAVLQIPLCLRGRRDQPDGADRKFRICLLQGLREGSLGTVWLALSSRAYTHATRAAAHLVARGDRDLLFHPVARRAHVDEVDVLLNLAAVHLREMDEQTPSPVSAVDAQ